jgi:hypothetical protein
LPAYKYTGYYERSYGGRAVRPGDVVELDSPPAGYEFALVEEVPAESPESPAEPIPPAPVPEVPPADPAPVAAPAAPVQVNPYAQPPAYVH